MKSSASNIWTYIGSFTQQRFARSCISSKPIVWLALLVAVTSGCTTTGSAGEKKYALQFVPGSFQLELGIAQTIHKVVTVRNNWTERTEYTLIPPDPTYGEDSPVLWIDINLDTIEESVDAHGAHDLELEISCPVVPGPYQFELEMEWEGGTTSLVIDADCVDAPIPTIVAEATRVLDAETRIALESYDPTTGTLVFSSTTSMTDVLEPGHVLVSEPATPIPEGLLRVVSSVDRIGPKTIVGTEEAGLADAFDQFSIDEQYEPAMRLEDVELLLADPGLSVGFVPGIDGDNLQLGFTFDEVLFDQDRRNETTADQLRVSGSVAVDIQPQLTAKLAIRWEMVCLGVKKWGKCWGIKTKIPVGISAYYWSGVTLNQNSQLKVKGNVDVEKNWQVPIARQYFQPTVLFIGPVPVVITHSLTYFLDANFKITAELTYEYKQTSSIRAGIEYNGTLRAIGETKRSSSDRFEFNGALEAGLYFGARWESRLYGVIGPFAQLRAGLRLDVQVKQVEDFQYGWRLHGCLVGDVGLAGSIKLFIITIGPYSRNVIDKCVELKNGEVTLVGAATGRVIAADGTPLGGALVTVGSRQAISDPDGHFRINLPPRRHQLVVRQDGYTVANRYFEIVKDATTDIGEIALSPLLSEADQLRIVLTWDQVNHSDFPGWYVDLDAHLGGAPGSEVTVNWWGQGSLTDYPYAMLEADALGGTSSTDRTEVLTIAYLYDWEPYTYVVHDYFTRDGASCQLPTSGAKVAVFRGSTLIASFGVPPSSAYECPDVWSVFSIDGDTGELAEINVLTWGGPDVPDKY